MPALAQASSAGYEYSSAPPTATGGNSPTKSNLHGGSQPTNGIGSEANSGGKGSDGKGGSSAKPGGSNATGNGQGNQGNGQEGGIGGTNAASTAEPGSDSGGSSPLVPILIAILVLAGGSIAYVMIKRRRAAAADVSGPGAPSGSSDSSATPEAG